jgi:hypothetical protein
VLHVITKERKTDHHTSTQKLFKHGQKISRLGKGLLLLGRRTGFGWKVSVQVIIGVDGHEIRVFDDGIEFSIDIPMNQFKHEISTGFGQCMGMLQTPFRSEGRQANGSATGFHVLIQDLVPLFIIFQSVENHSLDGMVKCSLELIHFLRMKNFGPNSLGKRSLEHVHEKMVRFSSNFFSWSLTPYLVYI